MKRFTVIFVCTGNTCRSPMAEGILKGRILDEAASGRIVPPIDVLSAGIHAAEGLPPSRFAIDVAAGHGIDIRLHRARQLTGDLVRFADLILVMEPVHAEYIRYVWPGIGNVEEIKRCCLAPSAPVPESGIADPAGQGVDAYRDAFAELREEITRISKVLFPRVLNGDTHT